MFERLGHLVSRHWAVLVTGWALVFALLTYTAPKWQDVANDGEFGYLPTTVPSFKAESLFKKAFSHEMGGNGIVIVARRENSPDGLRDEDKTYIEETLVPRLEKAVGLEGSVEHGDSAGAPAASAGETGPDRSDSKTAASQRAVKAVPPAKKTDDELPPNLAPVVASIRTFSDKELGPLLISDDQKATLIVLEMTTDFTQRKNEPTIAAIETLIGIPGQPGQLQLEKGFPAGLDMSVSGSPVVGMDMREAARRSARATENATIALVVVLLLAIYRAPIVAFIPLITVAVSVKVALLALTILAQHRWAHVFVGLEVYVIVVCYGAGIDYCMFLMSRYKEELDNGATFEEAITTSVSRVGHALAASAGTVMCGIGMMYFTQFGKFQQAGVAMSFSLIFVLAASLTLTPALLRLTGRWTFWPHVYTERITKAQGWISPTNVISRLLEREWFGRAWDKVGAALLARPGRIWLISCALMLPFAVVAVLWQNKLSYGLLSELPPTDPSVVGAAAVQSHFSAGITGPVTLLLENREANFRIDSEDDNRPGWKDLQEFVDSLYDHRQELGIVDVRAVADPLGMTERGKVDLVKRRLMLKRAQPHYVSDKPGLDGQVTRIDVILNNDPFSPDSIARFDYLKKAAPKFLPQKLAGSQLNWLGATASIQDLKTITREDQVRIDFLVPAVVFLILVILLRRIATSAYLIFTVFFSYLVTLGVTFVVFYLLDRHGFAGLDWKVPMFLFTILVAVGEDYNILLMARIAEEQQTHGSVDGIVVGLRKTGSIISSCGIIMAGTFSALMFGSLEGLTQLGFALAFGVLLDTFVVRPILVPAYLILLHQGWFGSLGRYLGADDPRITGKPEPIAVKQ